MIITVYQFLLVLIISLASTSVTLNSFFLFLVGDALPKHDEILRFISRVIPTKSNSNLKYPPRISTQKIFTHRLNEAQIFIIPDYDSTLFRLIETPKDSISFR